MQKVVFKQKLNQKFWDDKRLIPQVRKKMLSASKFFIQNSNFITPQMVYDIWFMGSNCSYNYTNNSDIDIHVVIDFKKIVKKQKIVRRLFDYYASFFNTKYNIKIKSLQVQFYVQNTTQDNKSKGIYSLLSNKWIRTPQKQDSVFVNVIAIKKRYNKIKQKIKKFYNKLQQLQKIKQDIKQMRIEGLSQEGQYSIGNLVFKQLRNHKILQLLINRIITLKNKQMTMEERQEIKQSYEQKQNFIINKQIQGIKIPNVDQLMGQLQFNIQYILNYKQIPQQQDDYIKIEQYDPNTNSILFKGIPTTIQQMINVIQYVNKNKPKYSTMYEFEMDNLKNYQ